MHHYYTRRIVVGLVLFFAMTAVLFGPLVVNLRGQLSAAAASQAGGGTAGDAAVTLPDGQATFADYCAGCHQAQEFADEIAASLDPDATSRAHLEKLAEAPGHGGVSPLEALAVVIHLRTLAGLPSTYPAGVPTPAAVATEVAAQPTPTPISLAEVEPADYAAVWEQNCSKCHEADEFAEGLMAADDPDQRTLEAVEYLTGPPPHRKRPVEAFAPAMNHIRQLAGLEPLP